MIIMLQWLRLYTLGSRGSRELKTFIEIHLISSRIDQKLKNKKGEYMLLKRILGQKSWPIDAVVGPDCKCRGSDSLGRRRGLNPAMNSASISLQMSHDCATIGPRSHCDQATIVRRSCS